MKNIRDIIRFWEARCGQSFAMATLVAVHGSSYRQPGARMLISAEGEYEGGVSAGCIEEEVIAGAREVFRSGEPQLMTFDTRLRFGCHGTIEIFVELVTEEFMAALKERVSRREGCRLETVVHGKARGTRISESEGIDGAFVQTIEPLMRLVLIGDTSDTVALRAHAALLGWDVVQFQSAPTAAGALDERTAVVVATHNFGRDCAALRELMPAGLRYLGLVGSRRRREDVLFAVMQNGVARHSCLFAPAGLHLGAESPEEIALSIVAEIQCVFGAGTAQQLRHRKAPIHQPLVHAVACAELVA